MHFELLFHLIAQQPLQEVNFVDTFKDIYDNQGHLIKLSNNYIVNNQALSNTYLKSEGLYELRDGWIKLHHSTCANPHAGRCESRRLETVGYPIRP